VKIKLRNLSSIILLLLFLPCSEVRPSVHQASLLREQTSSASASEREMTFAGAGGISLLGTLVLPVGARGKVPGVLLLAGSGPTDRNGNAPSIVIDLLKQIAERLAQEGYASLRFDKRATASYAKFWPTNVAQQNDFFSWDSFVGDAKAALACLQTRPEVDGKRVVVAGHSEGATIAMQIGRDLQGVANAPAGLILISAPGRTGAVILREQITLGLKRNGVPAEQARLNSDYVDLAINQIERDGTIPPNPPTGLGIEYLFPASAAKLMRVEFGFDPTRVLPIYEGPVLVLQGEKDIQVSATRDTPLLDAALKQRKRGVYEVFIVPSASHNLKKVDNDEPGLTGPVILEALNKIAAWMKRTFPN
jgi:pimeloyl-ACP methyl ester carboxylesterase